MWINFTFHHMKDVKKSEISFIMCTIYGILLHFTLLCCKKLSFLAIYAVFRKIGLLQFTRYCVEKILAQIIDRGEKMTNIRYGLLRHMIRVMRKHDLTKKRQRQRKRLRQLQMHLENTFKERSLRPLTSGIIGENSASQSIILARLGLLTINRIYSALLSSCSKAAHIKDNLEL